MWDFSECVIVIVIDRKARSRKVMTESRISDLIPRSWEGSNVEGKFRQFMPNLHLWMASQVKIKERQCWFALEHWQVGQQHTFGGLFTGAVDFGGREVCSKFIPKFEKITR